MGMFRAAPEYDRRRILKEAARAESRGRTARAIALYREVLAVERGNLELHAKLAPLLAKRGCAFDAWSSFRFCVRAALQQKQLDLAASLYRQAAHALPTQIEAWQGLADVERRRGQGDAAVAALREGRKHMRGGRLVPQAIALLRALLEIEPWCAPVVLDLARLLARTEQEAEARLLLQKLAGRCDAHQLGRVRAAQWRLDPTVGNTWRWLRAAWAARAETRPLRGRAPTS